jgi:hypothetical protein
MMDGCLTAAHLCSAQTAGPEDFSVASGPESPWCALSTAHPSQRHGSALRGARLRRLPYGPWHHDPASGVRFVGPSKSGLSGKSHHVGDLPSQERLSDTSYAQCLSTQRRQLILRRRQRGAGNATKTTKSSRSSLSHCAATRVSGFFTCC